MSAAEPALEPDRPIIDPHLHAWDILPKPELPQQPQRFLLPEVLYTIGCSGHRITHSVFVECHQMYREDAAPELRSLGETEFANGMAAMSASGTYGPSRIAHRIVGNVDLLLGSGIEPVLHAHRAAAGERFRGVRMNTAFRKEGLFGRPCDPALRHILIDPALQNGARVLASMDLSLDVWCLDDQLIDLVQLARAVPELSIVLDHLGTSARSHVAGFPAPAPSWTSNIRALAEQPNVFIKLGGLGMDLSGPIANRPGRIRSDELARLWLPYIRTAIDAFGPSRSMFESNFPPDQAAADYGTVWNAFKIIAKPYSDTEKDWLFRRTAATVYRID